MKRPQERPLGAQISHMLKDRGVDVIFGIPGVHNQEMYRGIEEAGITHVLARHEQGAGFMADGYARATGNPGVAYVITGPGVCNIMTAMGQAYSDSVPVLVISSCLDEVAAKRGQLHQMLDQEGAGGCVCDWSETARTADAAYQLIDRALVEFVAQKALPKHIQVPIAALQSNADTGWDHPYLPSFNIVSPNKEDINRAVYLIKQAKRPIFVFGGGAKAATKAAREVMRMTGSASFCTYAGRGVIGPDDPLHFGSMLARGDTARVLAGSDLVVTIGTELSEVDLWRDHLGHDCQVINVNRDTESIARGAGGDHRVVADSGCFLRETGAGLKGHTPATDWTPEEVTNARARWRAETDAERPGIVPICDALREVVPSDTMIYSDMTQIAYVAKEVWDMDRPGHWHHPYGFGTLGYALPAGIGGAVARRVGNLPTMVIAGDYGFQYTMQELGVAVELGLPIPIILWDNGKLKEIEDSMVRAQIAPNAVIARNPDFCKLAEAFGARSAAPKNLSEMQSAVQAAFKADGPTLIHITPEIVA